MIIDMRQKLGFENVVTGYGLTESHGIATMCRHDDDRTGSPRPAQRLDHGRHLDGFRASAHNRHHLQRAPPSPTSVHR